MFENHCVFSGVCSDISNNFPLYIYEYFSTDFCICLYIYIYTFLPQEVQFLRCCDVRIFLLSLSSTCRIHVLWNTLRSSCGTVHSAQHICQGFVWKTFHCRLHGEVKTRRDMHANPSRRELAYGHGNCCQLHPKDNKRLKLKG